MREPYVEVVIFQLAFCENCKCHIYIYIYIDTLFKVTRISDNVSDNFFTLLF